MEQTTHVARTMRFGAYEADLEAGELRKSGRRINLQEQPFQVLAQLLAHPGKLVTREDLQKRLWPADTFVDFDLGLNTAIKKIRAALGDSADHPKFIETLPKRGYRFICPVEQVASEESAEGRNQEKDAIAARTIPVPAIPETSLATPSIPKLGHFRVGLALGSLAVILLAAGFSWIGHRNRLRQEAARQPIQSADEERFETFGTRNADALESYKEGLAWLQSYDYDKAIQAFDRSISADPYYAAAFARLSMAQWQRFKKTREEQLQDEAGENCNRAHELNPNLAVSHFCQGEIHFGRGKDTLAVSDFTAALQVDSQNPDAGREHAEAYRSRGAAYERMGEKDKAKQDFQQAISKDPDNWLGYALLGGLYFHQSKYDQAIEQYLKARDYSPGSSEPHSDLGAAYFMKNQCDKAIPELQTALKLRPNYDAFNNLAICALNARRFEEAATNFEQAVRLSPANYGVRGSLARAYFWIGKKSLAEVNYRQAIDLARHQLILNSEDADATLMLAVYHAMLGERDAAINNLDRASQLRHGDSETAFWAAIIHWKFGDRAQSLISLRQAKESGYSAADINAAPELGSLRNDPEFIQIISSNRRSQ